MKQPTPVPLPVLVQRTGLADRVYPDPLPPVTIRGIAFDSRQVQAGDVFVALQGLHTDGHRFIEQACTRGAAALVCEQRADSWHRLHGTPVIKVADGRVALSRLAAEFYGHPSRSLTVTGVTGTNGKTTTTFMLEHILRQSGLLTGLIGTLVDKIDHEVLRSAMTTPDAPYLHRLMHAMEHRGVDQVVMEASSHALSQRRTDDIAFDAAVLTNISEDHGDIHESQDDYVRAKSRLFASLPPEGLAVLNLDDPHSPHLWRMAVAQRTETPPVVVGYELAGEDTGGDHGPPPVPAAARLRAVAVRELGRGLRFELRAAPEHRPDGRRSRRLSPLLDTADRRLPVELQVSGRHNVYNAAGAAAAALGLGIPAQDVQKGLSRFRGLPRRLQVIHRGTFTIVDDFAHNPASLHSALATIETWDWEELILVHGVRGNRGTAINRQNGGVIGRWAQRLQPRCVIVSLSASHVEDKDQVAPEEWRSFVAGITGTGVEPEEFVELPDALEAALSRAGDGDLILLTGAQAMDQAADLVREMLGDDGRYEADDASVIHGSPAAGVPLKRR